MNEHTKNEWETKEEIDLHIGIYPKNSKKNCIAIVWADETNDVKVNARLIAAAPDLLAACELAVSEMEILMFTFQRLTGHQYNIVVNDIMMGRALIKAIAKAKP